MRSRSSRSGSIAPASINVCASGLSNRERNPVLEMNRLVNGYGSYSGRHVKSRSGAASGSCQVALNVAVSTGSSSTSMLAAASCPAIAAARSARSLADRFGGGVVPLDRLPEQLEQADMVVSSTASPHAILGSEELDFVMREIGRAHV